LSLTATITQFSGGVTAVVPSESLVATSNYLFSLCRGYNLQAQNIINVGGGGSVSPVAPTSTVFPLYITSADFTDATHYDNPDIVGYTLSIFINEWTQQWLVAPAAFSYTATGINITLLGFDSTQLDYTILIQKITT
jgi:hypothetical protein